MKYRLILTWLVLSVVTMSTSITAYGHEMHGSGDHSHDGHHHDDHDDALYNLNDDPAVETVPGIALQPKVQPNDFIVIVAPGNVDTTSE